MCLHDAKINPSTLFKKWRNVEIYIDAAKQAIEAEPPIDCALCLSERVFEDGKQAGDSRDEYYEIVSGWTAHFVLPSFSANSNEKCLPQLHPPHLLLG